MTNTLRLMNVVSRLLIKITKLNESRLERKSTVIHCDLKKLL